LIAFAAGTANAGGSHSLIDRFPLAASAWLSNRGRTHHSLSSSTDHGGYETAPRVRRHAATDLLASKPIRRPRCRRFKTTSDRKRVLSPRSHRRRSTAPGDARS
jgi:hypothetical protein